MDITLTKSEATAFDAAMERGKDRLHILRLAVLVAEIKKAELDRIYADVEAQALNELKATGEAGSEIETGLDLDGAAFDRWNKRGEEICIERGYANPDGTYANGYNRYGLVRSAEDELIAYFLPLVPAVMREPIERGIKRSEVSREKFVKIAMGEIPVK